MADGVAAEDVVGGGAGPEAGQLLLQLGLPPGNHLQEQPLLAYDVFPVHRHLQLRQQLLKRLFAELGKAAMMENERETNGRRVLQPPGLVHDLSLGFRVQSRVGRETLRQTLVFSHPATHGVQLVLCLAQQVTLSLSQLCGGAPRQRVSRFIQGCLELRPHSLQSRHLVHPRLQLRHRHFQFWLQILRINPFFISKTKILIMKKVNFGINSQILVAKWKRILAQRIWKKIGNTQTSKYFNCSKRKAFTINGNSSRWENNFFRS